MKTLKVIYKEFFKDLTAMALISLAIAYFFIYLLSNIIDY